MTTQGVVRPSDIQLLTSWRNQRGRTANAVTPEFEQSIMPALRDAWERDQDLVPHFCDVCGKASRGPHQR